MEIHESRDGDVVALASDGSLAGGEETAALEARLSAAHQSGVRRSVVDFAEVGQLTGEAARVLPPAAARPSGSPSPELDALADALSSLLGMPRARGSAAAESRWSIAGR
jgi:hypothetical protein